MRLDLTVTHAPDIKSKQPWPRLTWLGKQKQDLLLVDSRRIKVLCLSGKGATKKKVAKLQSHLAHLAASSLSSNGAYLVCLLESGNLLIYQKDNDVLKTVPGIDQLARHKTNSSSSKANSSSSKANSSSSKAPEKETDRPSGAPLVFISGDASKILVVVGQRQLFLWEVDQPGMLSSAKQHILKGTWSCIDCDVGTLPGVECKEASIDATFFSDSVLGSCCICSFVFNQRTNVHISSVFLHWLEPYHVYSSSQPRFTARWSTLSHPLCDLSESAEPVRHRGAYLARHARGGLTLAVAVNQRSPVDTRVLFVSVLGSAAVSTDMKGCGCRKDNIRTDKTRFYWLADMAWTADDLFLACITKQGCLSLLSRLGEAVVIQSSGCSIEHEPGYFLPFHPLITFIPSAKHTTPSFTGSRGEPVSPTSSLRSLADEKRQRYSISAHPSLPLLVLSDGYLATVVELPGGQSCPSVVRDFLSQGRTAVNLLLERQGLRGRRLMTLSMLELQRTLPRRGASGEGPSRGTLTLDGSGPPTFTLTRDGLLSTADSDFADYAGRFSHLEEGQFVFGSPADAEGGRVVTTLRDADGVTAIADGAQKALLSAWGLAVSHTGEWTNQMEDLLQYTARTLVKLLAVMLQAAGDSRRGEEHPYASTLFRVLNLFKAATTVLHWDVAHRRSLPTGYRLIKGTVGVILKHGGRRHLTAAPRCCISILQFCEKLLANVYSLTAAPQPTFCHLRPYPFHRADLVEGALLCRDSVRIKGAMGSDDRVPRQAVEAEETGRSRGQQDRQEVKSAGIAVRHTPAKRLNQIWKLLFRHLVARYRKLLKDSATRQSRGVRRVLLLLCGVQMKLRQLGCRVSVALFDEWSKRIDAHFLSGCQLYLEGYPEEAVACWQTAVHQTKELQNNAGMGLPSNQVFPGHGCSAVDQRPVIPTTGSSALLSYSLLAILYTRLVQYNLVAALSLADSLVECYGLGTQDDGRGRAGGTGARKRRLLRSGASFFGRGGDAGGTPPQLPCIPDPICRATVQTLARFMALYFTNHTLFVYPPCAARSLPPLHQQPLDSGACRTVPIYHDRISTSVRQQQLSNVWTADTAMALLLVCGLLPEAVWLARELGDWKSALMLSVMTSQQLESGGASDEEKSPQQMLLTLPESLTPLVIVKEGISVILQTPLTPPSPAGGMAVRRNSSFSGQDRRGSHSLAIPAGMRRSSSMCSINEEDRVLQEQLSRSLTDMLTAATVAGLDTTPWLLTNLMQRCLSLVGEFNTLVPEEFYLPAPPFYCPQPDYEPKDDDPEEVLFESSLRRQVNDVIQLILQVLSSARCSLPCARWYVQQLDLLATVEAKTKKVPAVPLPSVLVGHARFPVDLLETGIGSASLPPCTVALLRAFRDLCTTVWMLHCRDKLTLAVRKYQASRERWLRVKPQNNAEVAKDSELLQDVLVWADNLYPFSSFLNLEEEVQDILLTAIAELPPTKRTVAVLARHFHENVSTLSQLLQEKFRRLTEKLKRKRELSARKATKKKPSESGKENKRVMKYETLHQHFRYQCKQRKLAVKNRQEEIGLCELQVFGELSEESRLNVKETRLNEDGVEDSRLNSGGRSTPTSNQDVQTGGSQRGKASTGPKEEDIQYPCIGSREFESSPGYFDFLETFFLVAFGKIIQESAPFSGKPKLPLINAYATELRQKEVGSVIRRMAGNSKPLMVELDASSLVVQSTSQDKMRDTVADDTQGKIRGSLDDGGQNKRIKSRSMFHHKPDPSEENPPLISLRRHGSRSSFNSSWSTASQQPTAEPPLKQGILQPYSTIVMILGAAYQSKAELLQWFGRWAERQLAVYSKTLGQSDNDSKAVLRVRLPQQLVLNSMWLASHVYHANLFEVQSDQESSLAVMAVQEESLIVPRGSSLQFDEAHHAKTSKLPGEQQRKNGEKRIQQPHSGRHRRTKTRRTSKKKTYESETDSEECESSDERLKNSRRLQGSITEKRVKKKSTKATKQLKPEGSARPRKRRQLPEVTEAHRSTSPRIVPTNKKVVNQLLMRAKSPRTSKGSKSKLLLDKEVAALSDGGESPTNLTSQEDVEAQPLKRTKKKSRADVPDPTDRSQMDDRRSKSRGGIFRSDVFYYSDHDTSSTLDISSLDEADKKAPGQENWLVDSETDLSSEDSEEDAARSQKQEIVEEAPKSLNLNMKDADVKRLVREEFMRMMERSKLSRNIADRSLPISATSESSQVPKTIPKGYGATSDAGRQDHQHALKGKPSVRESSGWAETLTTREGVDEETQAPSPLMPTQRGVPADLRSAGFLGADASVQTERTPAGLDQSGPGHSASEAPDKLTQNGFKPRLHSTAYGSDSWMGRTGRESDRRVIGDEAEMSPLSLQDLDGEDAWKDSVYAHRSAMQPGKMEETPSLSHHPQPRGDGPQWSDRPPPPAYLSTFRFAMKIPLLLTVPSERLAQGSLGSAGVRHPLPSQGTPRETSDHPQHHQDGSARHLDSQSRAPPSYFGHHRRKAESQSLADSAGPRNADNVPPLNHRLIPPLAPPPTSYEDPVGHLVSLLHPNVSQHQQQHHGDLPPIPLLHMAPRYPAPTVPPPPRHPHIPMMGLISGASHPLRNAHGEPPNPLPLLNLEASDARPPQLVPLEELSAFERGQRRGPGKHPAVRAREARERMEGGMTQADGPQMPAPIQLLHADLRKDVSDDIRLKRHEQEVTKPEAKVSSRGTPVIASQSTGDARQPAEQPRHGDKLPSRSQGAKRTTEEEGEGEEGGSREATRGKSEAGTDQERPAAGTRVILVEEQQEEQELRGSSARPKASPVAEESESEDDDTDEEEDKTVDAPMRREDLGSGYAIKPGSFDAMLSDRDARTAIPTAAQVHYDAVQQLQAKPQPRPDASAAAKRTKNVSTSMGRDDFPLHKPTVAEITSQYTTAATGLADTGQILAPDIFFNLRFGSPAAGQQPGLPDKKDSAPATRGRSFISVVDIDLKDVPSPAPSPAPVPRPDDRPQPSTVPTPPPPHPADDRTRAPSPTNAELHYNALFLKDAHPKKTPPKVQFDEEEEEEVVGGPDAVTLKMLDRKLKANSRQVSQSRARSETARQSTKEKLSQRLAQMDQQLNAIEESAANMQEDFRSTSLMLHTVENLAEAMAPEDTRPKADYSFRNYREPDRTGDDHLESTGGPAELHEVEEQEADKSTEKDASLDEANPEIGDDDERRVTMETEEEGHLTGFDGGEDTALTLGISGISGVSDIIAEVIAGGDADDAQRMGISTRQQKAARKRVEQRRVAETRDSQDIGRLSSREIRELLETPRTPRPESDEEEGRWPSKRKPAERSEKERKELQEWASKKRTQSLADYKKQRGVMIEKEHKPYQTKGRDAEGPSTLKEIRKHKEERDQKKKDMAEATHSERVQQAKALMAEIFTEKPRLPPSEAPSPATKRQRDGTLGEAGGGTGQPDTPGLSSGPDQRPAAGQRHQKGAYLFVDSGAYRARPAAADTSQGWVAGRSDSRGAEPGLRREQGESGRWTAGLQSTGRRDDRPHHQLPQRRRENDDERGREMAEDWPEGLSEVGEGEMSGGAGEARPYRPKPYDQVVRVQRPEVTRKQPGPSGKQKTYTEMLQEMTGETNKKRSTTQTLKAKQRLYGTIRIPGSARVPDSTTPRATKTYSESLASMQQKSGSQTRLRPRTRPRGVPRIDIATMSFGDDPHRRQQVEGRGLHPEPTPRSSMPYHERQNRLSLSGTYRARDDVVSPVPRLGIRYKPKESAPTTYVERLQRASMEAPRTHRNKTVYVGATPRGTYKSPPLHVPSARPRPYPRPGQRSPGVEEWDERSGLSDLSSWNVSDDVKNILQRRDSYEGEGGLTEDDDVSLDGLEFGDYTASVDVKELEDIASVSSGSIMSNIDWGAVEKMIADVK